MEGTTGEGEGIAQLAIRRLTTLCPNRWSRRCECSLAGSVL